jgi:hypothetical protein
MNIVQHHVILNGEQQGPFTIGQLRRMWESGQVNLQTQHFMDGYTEWMPLEYIREDLESENRPASQAPAPTFTPKPKKKSNAFPITVGALVIAGAFFITVVQNMGSKSGGSPPETPMTVTLRQMEKIGAEHGISVNQTGDRSVTLTLPPRESMIATEREAKELALTAQSRLGSGVIVRVKTPAGQTLAEAGP